MTDFPSFEPIKLSLCIFTLPHCQIHPPHYSVIITLLWQSPPHPPCFDNDIVTLHALTITPLLWLSPFMLWLWQSPPCFDIVTLHALTITPLLWHCHPSCFDNHPPALTLSPFMLWQSPPCFDRCHPSCFDNHPPALTLSPFMLWQSPPCFDIVTLHALTITPLLWQMSPSFGNQSPVLTIVTLLWHSCPCSDEESGPKYMPPSSYSFIMFKVSHFSRPAHSWRNQKSIKFHLDFQANDKG